MLKDNLALLRNIKGFSQEQVAQRIGVSRQAYAKWENGATVPDVEKCASLADLYGTTVDALLKTTPIEGVGVLPPGPPDKDIWGTVTMNDRGQLVIPKAAREKFGLKAGDRLVVCSDAMGIALIPVDRFQEQMTRFMRFITEEESQ